MDVALGKFFLDVLKELRDLFAKSKERGDHLIASGTFLELYGAATRLEGLSRRVREARSAASTSEKALAAMLEDFFREVHHFGSVLKNANLNSIEVFHPDMARALRRISVEDADIAREFRSNIARKYRLKPGQLKEVARIFADNWDTAGGWEQERDMWKVLPSFRDPKLQWNSSGVWSMFETLSNDLAEFREITSDVIRSTWEFKELATLPHARRG
jgi:hypothetical protein